MPRLLPLFLLVACGGGTKDSASEIPTVTLSYYLYDAITDAPVAGAKACDWPDATTCATSDTEGMIAIEAPADTDTYSTLEADGYYGRFFAIRTPGEDQFMGNNAMLAEAGVTLIAGMTGIDLEPGTGVIGFSTLLEDRETGVAGVTVTADKPLQGPYFTAEGMGGIDLEATETNSLGAGSFLNVPDGDYTLTFEGRPCTLVFGIPAAEPNQVRLKVIADHWTHVDMVCEPATR